MLPATHRRVCCTSGSPGGLEETEPAAAENVAPIGVPALAGHAVSPLAPPMAVADMGATASVAILVEIAAAAVPEVAAAIWGLGPPVIRTCLAGPMVAPPCSVRRQPPRRQTGAGVRARGQRGAHDRPRDGADGGVPRCAAGVLNSARWATLDAVCSGMLPRALPALLSQVQ